MLKSMSPPAKSIIDSMFHSNIKSIIINKNIKEMKSQILNLDIYDYATVAAIASEIIREIIYTNYEFFHNGVFQ